MTDTEHVLAETEAVTATARAQFLSDVERLLTEARDHAERLAPAIGEVSSPTVFVRWARDLKSRLNRRIVSI